MKKLFQNLVVAAALVTAAVPALAHHGYAAYDLTKVVNLKGTVTDYELANPHSTMTFDVKDPSGKTESWVAEAGHIRLMQDEGWTAKTLKEGDVVTFYFHPAKNGSHAVDLVKVMLPNGKVLYGHSSHDAAPIE